jgi:hypothetical protein
MRILWGKKMVCKLRVLASDRWKMSFSSQLGQFEWNVVPFGLPGSSSLMMRVTDQALTVGLDFSGDMVPAAGPTRAGRPLLHRGTGASRARQAHSASLCSRILTTARCTPRRWRRLGRGAVDLPPAQSSSPSASLYGRCSDFAGTASPRWACRSARARCTAVRR